MHGLVSNGSAGNNSLALGIDIGGTGIKTALVNVESGKMLTEPTYSHTPPPMDSEAIMSVIHAEIKKLNWQGAIGCGFPGVVKNGRIKTAANLNQNLIGADLIAEIKKVTHGPVNVLNDADAAGIAEMKLGAGQSRNNPHGGLVMMITLGTGIGSAMFINGQLVPNTEFGHFEMAGVEAEKLAATVIRERENLSWKEWGARVNKFLQLIEYLLSPDCIIIGGGVSANPEKFFPYIDLKAELLPADMCNNAGIIGAALAINY